nr:MgtC/SapB family protein [Aequorivita vladivostokensis]
MENVDLTRITGQIVVGVGFLGAGVIVKRKKEISGLATAAAIWCSAALGCLAALGMYAELAASTLIIVFINLVLGYYNKKIYKNNQADQKSE